MRIPLRSRSFKTFIFVLFLFLSFLFTDSLKVYFLDVDQGEASFIITPNNKTILIDAGDKNEYFDYGKIVFEFIKSLGFEKINVILISHPHSDHIGGMIYILSNMEIDTFYDPGFPYPSAIYQELLRLVKEKNIKYFLARENQKIDVDPSLDITILYPPKTLLFDTPNNNSVVLRIKYKEISFLFTGDIEKDAENEVVRRYAKDLSKVSSNILKVPHHGSNSSSKIRFLKLIWPEVAIISCGKNNRFGFPNSSVLSRYKNFGIEVYRTDLDGTIEVITDGKDYVINKLIK